MTDSMPMTDCPSPEILDAFHGGGLDPPARRKVIEHIATCQYCRDWLVNEAKPRGVQEAATALVAANWPARVVQFSRRRPISMVTLSAATVLLAAVMLRLQERLFAIPPINKVADAVERLDEWPLEGQLAGGFPERPQKITMRDGGNDANSRLYALSALRTALACAAREQPTSPNYHAFGLTELILGNEEAAVRALSDALSVQTGVRQLQSAIQKGQDATLLTNLSAALSQRAHQSHKGTDPLLAYEAAARAWSLRESKETAWNRAIAMDGLHATEDASGAWEAYLRFDRSSPWASKVRQRLERLRMPRSSAVWNEARLPLQVAARAGDIQSVRAVVAAFPGGARAFVEDELLRSWAEAVVAADAVAASDCLLRVRVIGGAIADVQSDPFLTDVLSVIDRGDSRRIAAAHVAYAQARRAYGEGRYEAARHDFTVAASLLEKVHSPMGLLARVYHAACAYNLNEYRQAIVEIEELRETEADLQHYRTVSGRAYWTLGTSNAFLGHLDPTRTAYEEALAQFDAANDYDLALGVREMLAGFYEMTGDRDRAWTMRLAVFALLEEIGPVAVRRPQALAGGARAARRHGYPAVALLLTKRELVVTRRHEPDAQRAAVLARRSELARVAGEPEVAAHYTSLAWRVVDRIKEAGDREFVFADPEFLRYTLPEERNDNRRLQRLRDAVITARRRNNRYWTVENNLLLSREYARQGDVERATGALTEALESVTLQEQSIRDLAARDLIIDEYRAANRELLGLLVRRNEPVQALLQAERSRARTVGSGELDAIEVKTESDLRALQRSISSHTAVVYYATLDDRLLTWLLTRDRIELFQTSIAREQLRTCIDAISTEGNDAFVLAAAAMSKHLVVPWIGSVAPATSVLVFIPDDETANVPFNALFEDRSMLIAKFGTLTAPSLAVHVAASVRDLQLQANATGPLLVVAAVDGRAHPKLAPLPDGRREVERLRRKAGVHVLDGADALPSVVLAALPTAGAIHIITHALSNEAQPSLSALVLQHENENDGLLHVHEIAALQLRSTRMVFIGACEAARAGMKAREGAATIGRAFLTAGVPAVIGSTRDLSDSATAIVVEEFYRRIDAGADPVTALRQTQLSMSRRLAPIDWATLQVMGGITKKEREPWLAKWK
jgi:CHAT domain-containing protein